ncbi:hypothetical protein ACFLZ6_00560 [Nanoarchaeota archaeon]
MPAIVIGKPKQPAQGQPSGMPPGASKPPGKEPALPTGEDIGELTRRIRTMEERYNTLQSKTQLIEQNMLSYHKQAMGETKSINSDFREIRREIEQIKDKILTLIKELQLSAKKDEVKVLERYINLWEPIHFVSRNEVQEIVKEEMEKNK